MMTEQELLVDCLRRLNASGVSYMLTGSMVSNYWGIPRTTHDLDFVVRLPLRAIPDLVQVFAEDFYIDEDAVRAALKPPYQFNALDERSALKVDFWVLHPEPFELAIFARREKVSLFGEPAWISTAEDIILHKLGWHKISPSERQLGDAAGVVAVQGERLDVPYMKEWAVALGVADTLDKLLSGEIGPKTT